jgi:hypothetical protein
MPLVCTNRTIPTGLDYALSGLQISQPRYLRFSLQNANQLLVKILNLRPDNGRIFAWFEDFDFSLHISLQLSDWFILMNSCEFRTSQPKDCACHKASFLNLACSAAVLLAKQCIRERHECKYSHFWQSDKP